GPRWWWRRTTTVAWTACRSSSARRAAPRPTRGCPRTPARNPRTTRGRGRSASAPPATRAPRRGAPMPTRDRYRLTPAHGWRCALCDLVVLEHAGERVPKCACGGEQWSERVRVAVPHRLAEASRFAAIENTGFASAGSGSLTDRPGHLLDCP